jgi:hypothetical protein
MLRPVWTRPHPAVMPSLVWIGFTSWLIGRCTQTETSGTAARHAGSIVLFITSRKAAYSWRWAQRMSYGTSIHLASNETQNSLCVSCLQTGKWLWTIKQNFQNWGARGKFYEPMDSWWSVISSQGSLVSGVPCGRFEVLVFIYIASGIRFLPQRNFKIFIKHFCCASCMSLDATAGYKRKHCGLTNVSNCTVGVCDIGGR